MRLIRRYKPWDMVMLVFVSLACIAAGCNGGGEEEFTCPDACTDGPEYTPPQAFVPPETVDLVRYVDPMIGTRGSGNVIPGALVPHGMVRLSPDTDSEGGSVGAYEYGDTRVKGFSHRNENHLRRVLESYFHYIINGEPIFPWTWTALCQGRFMDPSTET